MLSQLGIASRRQAEELIAAGRVTVNGKTVLDPLLPVLPDSDRFALDGAPLGRSQQRYLMLNKPRGLVTTRADEKGRATVYSCLPPELHGLSPVGRLDMASEGLLLFTNDHRWADRLLSPATHLPKYYHVQIDCVADDALLARLRAGIDDTELGCRLSADSVTLLRSGEHNSWLEFVLVEGRNRQIRRMLSACEVGVLRLVRVAIGSLPLGELGKGQWRELSLAEAIRIAGGSL